MSDTVVLRRSLWASVGALLLVGLLCAGQARAAGVITVNSTSQGIANDGRCTLAEAIIAANTDTASGSKPGECPAGHGPDTIILANAVYTLTQILDNEYDPLGLPSISSSIVLEGNGATLVRDPQAPEFGMMEVALEQARLTVNDLTIRGGRTSGDATAPGLGVYAGAQVTLNRVHLIDNISDHTGNPYPVDGAVVVGGATLTLIDSSVENNTGTHANGIVSDESILTLQHSTVSGHTERGVRDSGSRVQIVGTTIASNGKQGLQLWQSIATLTKSTISGNHDGGIDASASHMTLADSTVRDNQVTAEFGNLAAGVAIRSSSLVTLTRSAVFGNNEPGGVPPCPCVVGEDGIRVKDSSLVVIDSLIDDDRNATDLDFSLHFDGDDLIIRNSTITGAHDNPLEVSSAQAVSITFSTIVSKQASSRAFGNVAFPSSLYQVSNSIIGGCWTARPSTSQGYNVAQGTSCGFDSTGDRQGVDLGVMLGPLADNGGPTPTFALQPGAVAIDAIPAGVNGCQAGISRDQRGAPRAGGSGLGGDACDSGAYEAASTVPPSETRLYVPLIIR
ncbi:MAG: right-handed parallel beta-helix repeat-containing protein [Caldilineae bacterium]|nr:MAG: right-handed parallel beta-helix repeat-containing protein [Caldilineae bacterium]